MSAKASETLESGTGVTPTIFTEIPGVYVTRNGRQVGVHERREGSYFPIKGSLRYFNKNGVLHHRRFDIWTDDGRISVFGESPLDIVGVFQR